ncbi:MAG TPA: GtrA family protein [Candidatus Saccharimonadales bacterium]|nr:GtrA family protein [Candidatus Saccharimonadales bacterium]
MIKQLKVIWQVKVIRFMSVGAINTATDITLLNIFALAFHIPTLIANLMSASISISMSYFLNHHIVFRSIDKHSWTKFAHFFILTGFGILAIQTLVIYSITHLLAHHLIAVSQFELAMGLRSLSVRAFTLNIAKLLAVVVAMIWNFCMYHFIIFRNKKDLQVGAV